MTNLRPLGLLQAHGGTPSFLWETLPRGFALFLGGFTLLSCCGQLHAGEFDANLWWLDDRFLPRFLATPVLLLAAASFLSLALQPPRSSWRRRATMLTAGLAGSLTAVNSLEFYRLLLQGKVTAGIPVALSLFLTAGLGLVVAALWRNGRSGNQPLASSRLRVASVCAACALAFPVLQMLCFGKTDYRRQADAAVVLGARAYADGRPSDALADRVRTACQLYREGLAHRLIFSGGPGDGAVHETEAMRRMAVSLGVKPADILVDEGGLNTRATVRNTIPLFHRLHATRILVVSHAYHLPRLKLAYQARGFDVFTVPARESYFLRQLPYNMAREVAAFWAYYLRAVLTGH